MARRRRARIGAAAVPIGRTAAIGLAALGGLAALAGLAAAVGPAAGTRLAPLRPGTPAASGWTVYHGASDGDGVARDAMRLSDPVLHWRAGPLDGALYGEPLEAEGRVVVATEADTVYALAADTGAVLWTTRLGDPVPAGELPCGNIAPTVGVTGTPVIDLSRGELFVVADVLRAGGPSHVLVGLDLYSGRILSRRDVDPPGADPAAILQRTGLTLDGARVVFGFGGNDGDCGPYHGWVVSAPVSGSGPVLRYEIAVRPGDRQGAVWMGGAAPEVGAHGTLWIAVGNSAQLAPPFDGSDSVVELSRRLRRIGLFAPADWARDNQGDRDLGSTAPALVPNGTVVQVGKSGTAYLLRRSHLGGVGSDVVSAPACDGTDADGGDAVLGTTVYVPCQGGIEAFRAERSVLTERWDARGTVPSGDGVPDRPPIVAGGLVWAIGTGTLFGLDPSSGRAQVRLPIGSNANDFPTPSAADGLLLVTGGTSGDEVLAFGDATVRPLPPAAAARSPRAGTPRVRRRVTRAFATGAKRGRAGRAHRRRNGHRLPLHAPASDGGHEHRTGVGRP